MHSSQCNLNFKQNFLTALKKTVATTFSTLASKYRAYYELTRRPVSYRHTHTHTRSATDVWQELFAARPAAVYSRFRRHLTVTVRTKLAGSYNTRTLFTLTFRSPSNTVVGSRSVLLAVLAGSYLMMNERGNSR